MSYAVEVLDEVKDIDMPELLDVDRALGRVVAELVRDLHDDPWLGPRVNPQRARRPHLHAADDPTRTWTRRGPLQNRC